MENLYATMLSTFFNEKMCNSRTFSNEKRSFRHTFSKESKNAEKNNRTWSGSAVTKKCVFNVSHVDNPSRVRKSQGNLNVFLLF